MSAKRCALFLGLLVLVGACGTVSPNLSARSSGSTVAKLGLGLASPVNAQVVALNQGWNAVGFQAQQLTALSSNPAVTGFARWTGSGYATGSVTATDLNAAGGGRQGFWILASSATSFTYSGIDDGAGNFVDLALNGYQLVSFATSVDIPGSSLTATQNGQSVSLASVVVPVFQEVGSDNQYTAVNVLAGGVLKPGRAYWVAANTSNGMVRLNLPGAAPTPSPSPAALAIVSLRLTPSDPRVNRFSTVQFTLTALLADGSARDVTTLASWSSADPSVAALLSAGLFKGLNPSLTRVTASLSGLSAVSGLDVVDQAVPPGLAPTPTPTPTPTPRIYVADTNNDRIVRMDDMAGANNVSQSLGAEPPSFGGPFGVCVDGSDRIYVADTSNNRIVRMDNMAGLGNVSQDLGVSSTSFRGPRGVCVDGSSRIYVADAVNNRVVRMDDMAGLGNVSQDLIGSGLRFSGPFGVFVDASSRIYVADTFRNRIVRMDDMSGLGNVSQDLSGSPLGFSRPSGVFVDGSNRIYVADAMNNRIVRMDDMTGLGNVSQDLSGSPLGFSGPSGVFVDGSNRIYVADQANNRIVRMDNMAGANNVSQTLSGSVAGFMTPRGIFVR